MGWWARTYPFLLLCHAQEVGRCSPDHVSTAASSRWKTQWALTVTWACCWPNLRPPCFRRWVGHLIFFLLMWVEMTEMMQWYDHEAILSIPELFPSLWWDRSIWNPPGGKVFESESCRLYPYQTPSLVSPSFSLSIPQIQSILIRWCHLRV